MRLHSARLCFPFLRGVRYFSSTKRVEKGIILGVYEPKEEEDPFILTPAGRKFDVDTSNQLKQMLLVAGNGLKPGNSRVLHGVGTAYTSVAIANCGKQDLGFCPLENLDEGKEMKRKAVAGAIKKMRDREETEVEVDPCDDAEVVGEACTLSLFSFDELKAIDSRKKDICVTCHCDFLPSDKTQVQAAWKRGVLLAEGQNLARRLMEFPSNHLTPTRFVQEVTANLKNACAVLARDKPWVEAEKMDAFLAVAQGSDEPLKLLEIDYKGGQSQDAPVVLVGKGITFDSGGISLKPGQDMDKMRGDMGGAAVVVGSILTASSLKFPVNIKALIPLCENMPSGKAVKPGDVVTSMSGKTIQIDNTDAEGRLILADILTYAAMQKPSLIVDIATLTGAVDVALGAGAAAVYTNDESAWEQLNLAGRRTGDRVWRMPLFKLYSSHMTSSHLADINNLGKYPRSAGSCTAAAFLREFVEPQQKWVHLDIAGVMFNKDEVPYLNKGMTGRPTRTVAEFLLMRGKMGK